MTHAYPPQARGAVVVTGVSSGIGRAVADELAARGHHVFGSVRTRADADRVAGEIGRARFTPLLFDVADATAIREAAGLVAVRLEGDTLAGLVNSAGIATAGPLLHQSAAEFARHFEINVTGPFLVTQAFAPLLGADRTRAGKPGRIIIVSSISGGLATPFLGAYAASKHALEGYADALRRELVPFGIDVVIIAPGAVRTPIWDKAEQDDTGAYADTVYASALGRMQRYMVANGRKGLPPEHVGRIVADALSARMPKAHQPVLKGRFGNWTVPRAMPRRMLDRILARKMGLLP